MTHPHPSPRSETNSVTSSQEAQYLLWALVHVATARYYPSQNKTTPNNRLSREKSRPSHQHSSRHYLPLRDRSGQSPFGGIKHTADLHLRSMLFGFICPPGCLVGNLGGSFKNKASPHVPILPLSRRYEAQPGPTRFTALWDHQHQPLPPNPIRFGPQRYWTRNRSLRGEIPRKRGL